MRKRNNNNNKNNNNGKVRSRQPKQLILVKSIVSSPVKVDLNMQFVVHAVYNYTASLTMYSFSASLGQTSPTIQQNLTVAMLATTEFTKYRDLYDFYKVIAYDVIVSNSVMGSVDLVSAPPLFTRIATQISGSTNADAVARSDTAVEYKLTNYSAPTAGKYILPDLLVGANSNYIGGRNAWVSTGSTVDPSIFLQIGYIAPPSFATTLAASRSIQICTIDVIAKAVFASPELA